MQQSVITDHLSKKLPIEKEDKDRVVLRKNKSTTINQNLGINMVITKILWRYWKWKTRKTRKSDSNRTQNHE